MVPLLRTWGSPMTEAAWAKAEALALTKPEDSIW